jgi:3-deoxy-D-manno-octulosonic-acid transferase
LKILKSQDSKNRIIIDIRYLIRHDSHYMNSIIPLLYTLSLSLIAFMATPRLLYNFFAKKKYRNSLSYRLGLKAQNIEKIRPLSIWIHAVSVGETKAVAKLAKELKQTFGNDCQLVISTVTETGHAEAQRSLPFADHHIYLPFDLIPCIKPLVKKISPDLVVLCESDFWYNFLRLSKEQGAKIVLVNGKLSERSLNRFKWIPLFANPLFDLIDKLCIQNTLYLNRFKELGIAPSKMVSTGNLKFDEEYPFLSPQELLSQKKRLNIDSDDIVICAGSTHETEEALILNALAPLWNKFKIKLFLVPRHPERFNSVAELLEKEKIPYIRWTEITDSTTEEQKQNRVILVDTMGVLRPCYQLCDIAIIGGSFVKHVGGHNILEPCWYGKPVLYGPNMYTQSELVDLMNEYGAGLQIKDEDLTTTLTQWCQNPSERDSIGAKGELLITSVKGSVKRTFSALEPILEELRKKLSKK